MSRKIGECGKCGKKKILIPIQGKMLCKICWNNEANKEFVKILHDVFDKENIPGKEFLPENKKTHS